MTEGNMEDPVTVISRRQTTQRRNDFRGRHGEPSSSDNLVTRKPRQRYSRASLRALWWWQVISYIRANQGKNYITVRHRGPRVNGYLLQNLKCTERVLMCTVLGAFSLSTAKENSLHHDFIICPIFANISFCLHLVYVQYITCISIFTHTHYIVIIW